MYQLRDYQQEAVRAAAKCLTSKKNSIVVMPTGSGKSLVIAAIAQLVQGKVIILQPSKEILEQNLDKMQSFDILENIGVYSASMNRKDTGRITFATIGTVIKHKDLFIDCELIIVDECHSVNSKGGMYEEFINSLKIKTIGLTATPYRLRSYRHFANGNTVAESRILTRTRPRIFNEIIHITQVKDLFTSDYLCPLDYDWQNNYDSLKVPSNSTAQGFDENLLRRYNEQQGIITKMIDSVPASGARHCLAFCQFTAESKRVVSGLQQKGITAAEVSALSSKSEREDILKKFKDGEIRCVVNVGVLTTGFDFPALDCVIIGRPTRSLALYYQMIGRGVRIAQGKQGCRVFDHCDNVKRFGKIETFEFVDPRKRGLWRLRSDLGYVTGTDVVTGMDMEGGTSAIQPEEEALLASGELPMPFGLHKGKPIKDVPTEYLKWCINTFDSGKMKNIIVAALANKGCV